MRISSKPDDAEYHPLVAKTDFFQIYLDGVNVTKKYLMFSVDDTEGWIGIYKTDSKLSIELDEYNEPIVDILHGDVKIKFKSGG